MPTPSLRLRVDLFGGILLFGLLTAFSQGALGEELIVSNARALPFQLEGVPAFLEDARYEPAYFATFSGVPVTLPPDAPGDRSFQMFYGMLGIHIDAKGGYAVKQLKLFLKEDGEGRFTTRSTERTFTIQEKPLRDDSDLLHLASDEKAADEDSELVLNKTQGTGYIRNIIWKSADRTQKPSFDFQYPFRFVTVSVR